MGRTVLEPLALFLSPFVVYALYLALRSRYPLEVEHWTRGRISVMTLIGLAAAVLGLVEGGDAAKAADSVQARAGFAAGEALVRLDHAEIAPLPQRIFDQREVARFENVQGQRSARKQD